jgi:hypothetical protein
MDNFYHDDQVTEGFRDFRKNVSRPPGLINLYYVVLRVKIGHAVWYHHTAMAIDGDLPCHIEAIKSVVRVSLNWRKAELACVFVRNFITRDPSALDAAVQRRITEELNARISNGAIFCDKVERFLVFGFFDKNRIILLEAPARDAMEASKAAVKMCDEQSMGALLPIDIMAVSPVIPGIIDRFEKSAPQLLALAKAASGVSGR